MGENHKLFVTLLMKEATEIEYILIIHYDLKMKYLKFEEIIFIRCFSAICQPKSLINLKTSSSLSYVIYKRYNLLFSAFQHKQINNTTHTSIISYKLSIKN